MHIAHHSGAHKNKIDKRDLNCSILIKTIVSLFLNSFGLISWKIKYLSPNKFVFLMYHRVLSKERADGIQAGMYVEPETLEAHIRFLRKNFKILPLYELFSRKESHDLNSKPFCSLTFDDGYHDFYQYAFPILKEYQIPATVFLPTDFIGSEKWFWTDRLTRLFFQMQSAKGIAQRANDREQRAKRREGGAQSKEQRGQSKEPPKSGNAIVNRIENLKGSYEDCLERAIQILKQYRDEEIEEILSELSTRWSINLNLQERSFLSWEEVKEMAQSGLISFGSHTASHKILTTLSDEELWDELTRSKEKLIAEKVVDSSFIPFCYPNGNYNERIVQLVKEAGYNLAVTTENGWNRFGLDPFTLKRIGIHQDIASTEAIFGCRIANIF